MGTPSGDQGQTMKRLKILSLLIDLLLLVVNVAGGATWGLALRAIGALALACGCVVALFCIAVLALALAGQRQAPYPMGKES